jgi:hypothetical protein
MQSLECSAAYRGTRRRGVPARTSSGLAPPVLARPRRTPKSPAALIPRPRQTPTSSRKTPRSPVRVVRAAQRVIRGPRGVMRRARGVLTAPEGALRATIATESGALQPQRGHRAISPGPRERSGARQTRPWLYRTTPTGPLSLPTCRFGLEIGRGRTARAPLRAPSRAPQESRAAHRLPRDAGMTS